MNKYDLVTDLELIEQSINFDEVIADIYCYVWDRVEQSVFEATDEIDLNIVDSIAETIKIKRIKQNEPN